MTDNKVELYDQHYAMACAWFINGGKVVEAYTTAFPERVADTKKNCSVKAQTTRIQQAAREVLHSKGVQGHINDIRADMMIEEVFTPAEAMRDSRRIGRKAEEKGDYSTALGSVRFRAQMCGYLDLKIVIDKGPQTKEEMSDEFAKLVEANPGLLDALEKHKQAIPATTDSGAEIVATDAGEKEISEKCEGEG